MLKERIQGRAALLFWAIVGSAAFFMLTKLASLLGETVSRMNH